MEKKPMRADACCSERDNCKACAIASGEHDHAHGHDGSKIKKELALLAAGAVLFAIGLLLEGTASFVLLLLAYALLGAQVVFQAVKGLFSGNFLDENMLMSVATFGALALGDAEGFGVEEGSVLVAAVASVTGVEVGCVETACFGVYEDVNMPVLST